MSFLYILTISSLQRPSGVSQNVSGLYYVRRGEGYKIHMCAKLYYLRRAKVLSSVATDFGPSTSTFMHGFHDPQHPPPNQKIFFLDLDSL